MVDTLKQKLICDMKYIFHFLKSKDNPYKTYNNNYEAEMLLARFWSLEDMNLAEAQCSLF